VADKFFQEIRDAESHEEGAASASQSTPDSHACGRSHDSSSEVNVLERDELE
jgi:hypothetical protein